MAVSNGKIPDGTQARLTFTVSADAQPGEYPIDIAVAECYTIDEEDTVKFACAADTVRILCNEHSLTMIPPIPADQNNDGRSAGWKCDSCGSIVEEQEVLEKGKYLQIPESVTEIEEEAFADTAARQIVIPASVERIGDRAFQNSSELQIVIIPDTVLQIGNDAFSECDNVVIITSEGSTAEEYAIENSIPYVTENSFNNTETTLNY